MKNILKTIAMLILALFIVCGAEPVYAADCDTAVTTVANVVAVSLPSSGQGTFTIALQAKNTTGSDRTVTITPVLGTLGSSVVMKSVTHGGAAGNSAVLTDDSPVAFQFTFDIVNAQTSILTIPFDATDEGGTTRVNAYVKVTVAVDTTPSYTDYEPVVYKPSATLSYSLSASDGKIAAGEDNILTLTMTNNGDCTLSTAEIQLGQFANGISIVNGTDRKQLGNLNRPSTSAKNTSASATFHITADKDVETGIYAFPVTMSGYDPNGSRYTATETLYLQVNGNDNPEPKKPTTGVKTPILMVSSYSQNGTALAGSAFGLNITIQNTSQETLRNIKVTVGDGGGVFVPSGMSNSYYIETIEAGKTNNHSIRLSVDNNAPQATTPISVSMTYEDADGNSYQASDTIAVPVRQETRLVVDNISAISYAFQGETTNAEIQFYNMGKNVINNVKVSVSGDFDVTKNASVFVGNMQSGTSYTYKFNMIPLSGGTANGVVTITYDDASGVQQKIETPFNYEVQSYEPYVPGEDDPSGWDEPVPEKKAIPWKWIIIGGVVVLLALLLILRGAKKRKAAKALELEDSDEN